LYAIGTRPIAQYTSGSAEYLLPDALGSVRQIVDANGNVTLAESYQPYGTVLTSNGTASSIFGYSGEETDTSGLIYLRARYMQPTLGIFLARDPWSGDAQRPGSMNGWGYVEENPINAIDPAGLCVLDPKFNVFGIRRCQVVSGDYFFSIADDYEVDPITLIWLNNNKKLVPGDYVLLPCKGCVYNPAVVPPPTPQPDPLHDIPQFKDGIIQLGWPVDGFIKGGNWTAKFPATDYKNVYGLPGCAPTGVTGGGHGWETVYDLYHDRMAKFEYDFAVYGGPTSGSFGGSTYFGVMHGFSTKRTLEEYGGGSYATCYSVSASFPGVDFLLGVSPIVGLCGPTQKPWELGGTWPNLNVPSIFDLTSGLTSLTFGVDAALGVVSTSAPSVIYAKYYGPTEVRDRIDLTDRQWVINQLNTHTRR
jgi:RHS repeat-associated protein